MYGEISSMNAVTPSTGAIISIYLSIASPNDARKLIILLNKPWTTE